MKKLCSIGIAILLQACMPSDYFSAAALSNTQLSDEASKATQISFDGSLTLVADPKAVCLWDNNNSKLKNKCLSGAEVEFIEIVGISKNNQYYFTSNQVSVRLYSVANNQKLGEWQAGDNIINDIDISESGDKLLLGFRSGKAAIISSKTNQLAVFPVHRLDINSVSLSDDGKLAFTGSSDKKAHLWQTDTGQKLKSFDHRSRVNFLKISGDGTKGFTLDSINDRFFWQMNSGELIAELDTPIKFIEFNDAVFIDNNRKLLSSSPKQKLQMWQTANGKLLAQWQASQQRLRSSVLSISLKGEQVISITSDAIQETWPLPAEK